MSFLSKILDSKNAQLRMKVCDVIINCVQSLIELEKGFIQNSLSEEIIYLRNNYDSDESKLEKALFTLAFISKIYEQNGLDKKEFNSLVYSTFDLFATNGIKRKLKENGFKSNAQFLNGRLNFYINEIYLLHNLEHPNSGHITYFWYNNPLSLEEGVDKNIIILAFFLSVYPDYLRLVSEGVIELLINSKKK